jgi:Flp pilus assembly protein TadG
VRRFWRGRASERGQAVVLIVITMTAMLMAVGLAIDTGQLFVARRTMQEAADAGAYAGAVILYQRGTSDAAARAAAAAAATADVNRNGFTHGGDGGLTTVAVNAPPASGPHTGDSKYVEVVIATQVRTTLLPAQAQLNLVRVRGVAGAEPLNNGFAIMSLDRGSTIDAMRVQAGGHVDVAGAGILVNSTSPLAAENQGGTISVSPIPPYGTEVAGGVTGSWPNPTLGTTQRPDPFAKYPKPSTVGMTVYTSVPPGPGAVTLNPGIYTVPISAGGTTTYYLNSGIYIIKAGINGLGNADLISNAGGVFIFNTVMDYPTGTGGGCAQVKLAGTSNTTLAPLATGPYAGLLFYQDPACTADFKIAGSGTLNATGTIYLPNAKFVMDGTTATLTGSQLVAKTVDIQNGNVTITFNSGTTAQPILPRLSE